MRGGVVRGAGRAEENPPGIERSSLRRLTGPLPVIERRDAYELIELVQFHGDDFVDVAYHALLRREPDATGRAKFVDALRSGQLDRIEVLGCLRYSAEGRAVGVNVPGLLLPDLLRRAQQVPLVGRIVGIARYLICLPEVVRDRRSLEATVFRREKALRAEIDAANAQIERVLTESQQRLDATALDAKARVEAVGAQLITLTQATLNLQARLDARIVPVGDAALPLKGGGASPSGDGLPSNEVVGIPDARSDAVQSGEINALYASFEDRFRGPAEEVKRRLAVYLPAVRDAGAGVAAAPVLDLGCGRGDWLELLREAGLAGIGVDLNRDNVEDCRRRGLVVLSSDVLAYLRSLAEGSMGAITAMHVVEHLPFEAWIALIKEAHRVLRPGGVLILETPNPENVQVGSCNFWCDPTHLKPLPPVMLEYFVQASGFDPVRAERMHRYAQPVELPEGASPMEQRINQAFCSAEDYAVIATKPGAGAGAAGHPCPGRSSAPTQFSSLPGSRYREAAADR